MATAHQEQINDLRDALGSVTADIRKMSRALSIEASDQSSHLSKELQVLDDPTARKLANTARKILHKARSVLDEVEGHGRFGSEKEQVDRLEYVTDQMAIASTHYWAVP